MSQNILVLYYSRHGATAQVAKIIARGVHMVQGCDAHIRCVSSPDHTDTQHSQVSLEDLKSCDALALGSPSYYGGLAAPLKAFIDSTTALWMNGTLQGKPACVFTSSGSMHGGQEMALMSMLVPLMHHGMLIMGLPYTEAALNTTQSGGTPYGPSFVAGTDGSKTIDKDEKQLCLAMGSRLAQTAIKLSHSVS